MESAAHWCVARRSDGDGADGKGGVPSRRRRKIWILFGKPTSTDRKLLPDQPPMEVWTYANNVKKRFTFVDEEKNGVYRLTKVEDL